MLNAPEMKESAAAAWRCRQGIVGKLRKPNKMQFHLQSRSQDCLPVSGDFRAGHSRQDATDDNARSGTRPSTHPQAPRASAPPR